MDPTKIDLQSFEQILNSPYKWVLGVIFILGSVLALNKKYFQVPLRPKNLKERLEFISIHLKDPDLSPKLKGLMNDRKEEQLFRGMVGLQAKTKLRKAMIEFVEQSPPEFDYSSLRTARAYLTLDENQEKLAVKISKGERIFAIFAFIMGYVILAAGLLWMLILFPLSDNRLSVSTTLFRILAGLVGFILSALAAAFFAFPMRQVLQARRIDKYLHSMSKVVTQKELSAAEQPTNKAIKASFIPELNLTAIYEEAEEGGYIGYIPELSGVNTQGETIEEVRENLLEAAQLILEANREEAERRLGKDAKVTRESMTLRAG